MPGATETEFFERADMLDTKVGQGKKDDPADVAATGFKAMMKGEGDEVSGWQNKSVLAAQPKSHRAALLLRAPGPNRQSRANLVLLSAVIDRPYRLNRLAVNKIGLLPLFSCRARDHPGAAGSPGGACARRGYCCCLSDRRACR
jgi:hypothetical protein